MSSTRVTWHYEVLEASNRGGEATKTDRRTFSEPDSRALAEHFVAHVVSPLDLDWYRIETV